MSDDERAAIEQELAEAQAAVEAVKEARIRRQNAVMRALELGLTKYRIAAVLGVRGPTVDSIISTAKRDNA
jgi:DNA-binding NarL/FixJ family response regulator